MEEVDRDDVLDATLETVLRILEEMGVDEASEGAVLAAPPFYDGPVLLDSPGRFNQFNGQAAFRLGFVGYPIDEVAFLTVRQFCEMYVGDSYPEIPSLPLADEAYELDPGRSRLGPASRAREFPICFVVGPPRSGTTLLRVMLNTHSTLWAPGELNLANFSTMTDRAHRVAPFLRYMPIPEAAARCSESVVAFSSRFRAWERTGASIPEVYQHLHDADPGAMIVDKTSTYSVRLGSLERIGEEFPNASFIHLLRSPHDMIRSYVRMQFQRGDRHQFEAERNPYQAAEAIWFACNANAKTFLATIPSNRKCVIRYEDLTARPAESLASVCRLLGRSFEPQMADPYTAPGATISGAGDLYIHKRRRVEYRPPAESFYPLGSRCERLVRHYGY